MVNHNVNHKNIELINSLKNKEKIKILFVCLGNEYNNKYNYNPEEYGIPMTAMYEIEIPDRKEIMGDKYELPNPLYVVRTATKFSFKFIRKDTGTARKSIAIKEIKIDNIAKGKTFLMPHVNKKDNNQYWVVTERNNVVTLPINGNSTGTNKDWIDWMVAEAEKTKGDQNIDKYQWLTDYDVPEAGIQHQTFTYKWETDGFPVATTASAEPAATFYLPESQNLQKGESNPLKLQEYEVTLTASEEFGEEGHLITEEREYKATLPQLASLFRNTHVKVNVTFRDYTLDWEVDVEPYWEVVLEPVFGL